VNKIINAICILTGCSIPIFWSGVVTFAYPGVMSSYWQETFHVGNAETGLVVTFMLIGLALTMFISGRIHAQFGMAWCILIDIGVYVLSYLILFLTKNIYMLYLWAFIENIGCSFSYGPGLTTAQSSYPNHKGVVSGIVNLSFGIAAGVMTPVLNYMLEWKGYTFANIVIIISIVVLDFIAYLLIKIAKPIHLQSLKKEGEGERKNEREGEGREEGREEVGKEDELESEDMTVKEAVKTKEFWLIWCVWAFMGASGISILSLSKSYSLKIGQKGVLLHTLFNLSNGVFRIFIGILTDKIGAKITGALGYSCTALGYLIMPYSSNLLVVGLCTIGVGIGFGTIFTVTGPLASDIFGLKYFGMIYGLIFTAYGIVGGIVGPAVSGMILEKTHDNFIIVFTYLGIMGAIGTILTLCVDDKKRKREKKPILPTKIINETITE